MDKRDQSCIFCDRQADAYWSSDPDILVCYWCAVRGVFPKLQADALASRMRGWGWTWAKVSDAVQEMQGSFYRAMVIALLRHIAELNSPPEQEQETE